MNGRLHQIIEKAEEVVRIVVEKKYLKALMI